MLKDLNHRLEPFRAFRIARLAIVTGLYTGYFPLAPGTAGSALGMGLVYFLYSHIPVPAQVFVAVLTGLLAIWLSDSAQRHFKKSDPGQIVIDEIVGILFTMIGIPLTGGWILYGFILFRILDVVKLPPAKYFDTRLKNGWGIVMDDIVSGIYANLLLHLMLATRI